MPFVCIHGTFHLLSRTAAGRVSGFEPDGDSVHFRATNLALLQALPVLSRPLDPTVIGSTMLRLEAIDALELHFRPKGGANTRQPAPFAENARDELTAFLSLGEVRYAMPRGLSVVSASGDGAPGWILSRTLEVNGRPVSFAFPGRAPFPDGAPVGLTASLLKRSLNYHLLARGLAYPLFYDGLFYDLRRVCALAVKNARRNGLGLWPHDLSQSGAGAQSPAILAQEGVIFPKLFRRANEFWAGGATSLAEFPSWLARTEERVLDARLVHFTHFDNMVQVAENRLKMTAFPEDLVFISAL